jgi:hypothetical protein
MALNLNLVSQRFLQKLLSRAFAAYGVEERADEANYHKHMRNIVIAWSCGVHLQSCLDATREKLWKFMLNRTSDDLSMDHREAIFCHGLIMATEDEFDYVWRIFASSTNAVARRFYVNALGCIEDDGILMKFITTIIQRDELNADDIVSIIKATYSHNHVGLNITLQFLRDNYDAVIEL